jgi:hypothetical protein
MASVVAPPSTLEKETASSGASTLDEPLAMEEKNLESSLNSDTPVPSDVPSDEHVGPEESLAPTEVTWDGDNDPENPRNWPKWKKWYAKRDSIY